MQDSCFALRSRRFFAAAMTMLSLSFAGIPLTVQAQPQGQFEGQIQTFVPLQIVTAAGRTHSFEIEVADTDQKRMTGLMYRKTMPFNQGMLFDFKNSTTVQMWMKNTYLSLDMVFIRADGTIARIAENTEPLSEKIIASGEPVLAVLELLGGTCARLAIKPGDRVDFPLFRR